MLLNIKTSRLEILRVFDTETEIIGIKVYCLVSVRKDNHKTNYRFGTMEQMVQMLKTYRSVEFGYREEYDNFINNNKRFTL